MIIQGVHGYPLKYALDDKEFVFLGPMDHHDLETTEEKFTSRHIDNGLKYVDSGTKLN
jgi:hypothetical protein